MYNPYYQSIKRLYEAGRITAEVAHNAVTHELPQGGTLITEAEYREIVGLPPITNGPEQGV